MVPWRMKSTTIYFILIFFIAFWQAFYLMCPCCFPFSYVFQSLKCPQECLKPPCVQKCCPLGTYLASDNDNGYSCQFYQSLSELSNFRPSDFPLWKDGSLSNSTSEVDKLSVASRFCDSLTMHSYYLNWDERFAIMENGGLVLLRQGEGTLSHSGLTVKQLDKKDYCLDVYNGHTTTFKCHYYSSGTVVGKPSSFSLGRLDSFIFIIFTLALHICVNGLKSRNSKIVISFLICLVGTDIFTIFSYDNMIVDPLFGNLTACHIYVLTLQFVALATFCWVAIMCFDIWISTRRWPSAENGESHKSTPFTTYFLFGWGLPLAVVMGMIYLDLNPYVPEGFLKPNVLAGYCKLMDDKALMAYLVIPCLLLAFASVAMTVKTVCQLWTMRRDIKNKPEDSERRGHYDTEKKRFKTNIKFFLALFLPWIAVCILDASKAISELVNHRLDLPGLQETLYDWAFNLRGLLFFLFFVCDQSLAEKIPQKKFVGVLNKKKTESVEYMKEKSSKFLDYLVEKKLKLDKRAWEKLEQEKLARGEVSALPANSPECACAVQISGCADSSAVTIDCLDSDPEQKAPLISTSTTIGVHK